MKWTYDARYCAPFPRRYCPVQPVHLAFTQRERDVGNAPEERKKPERERELTDAKPISDRLDALRSESAFRVDVCDLKCEQGEYAQNLSLLATNTD